MSTVDDELAAPEIDWEVGRDLVGASARQVKFAQGLVNGLSQTASARHAGYAGTDSALRGAASRIAKSSKVRALVQWARAGGAGPSDTPGDAAELKKILWRHARAKDPARSIKATEVLHRIEAAERERDAAVEAASHDPVKTLEQIAKLSPILAALLAREHSITLELPARSVREALNEIEDMRRVVLARAAETNGATAPDSIAITDGGAP
jgi:hypothetical protein